VNLTARLEHANRVYNTQILMGETTAQAIAPEFEMREIDIISVKGKTETTRIFELLAAKGHLSEELQRLRECYERGRRAFLIQEWDTAESNFRECLQLQTNDGPSQVMIQHIQRLRSNPPGKDWNGAWQLADK
jgi:adenylate cyclase